MSEKCGLTGIALALVASASGATDSYVIYEASAGSNKARYYPGDACTGPSFGPVSAGPHVLVFTRQKDGVPQLTVSVMVQGKSDFRFLAGQITIFDGEHADGAGEPAALTDFKVLTGAGRLKPRTVRVGDVFSGPPAEEFIPYYRETKYDSVQWSFDSAPLRIPKTGTFSVQLPDGEADGEIGRYPLVTFRPQQVAFRANCLK